MWRFVSLWFDWKFGSKKRIYEKTLERCDRSIVRPIARRYILRAGKSDSARRRSVQIGKNGYFFHRCDRLSFFNLSLSLSLSLPVVHLNSHWSNLATLWRLRRRRLLKLPLKYQLRSMFSLNCVPFNPNPSKYHVSLSLSLWNSFGTQTVAIWALGFSLPSESFGTLSVVGAHLLRMQQVTEFACVLACKHLRQLPMDRRRRTKVLWSKKANWEVYYVSDIDPIKLFACLWHLSTSKRIFLSFFGSFCGACLSSHIPVACEWRFLVRSLLASSLEIAG